MDITIIPGKLKGCINVPCSKSHAHRLLTASFLAGTDITDTEERAPLYIPDMSEDLLATACCLKALKNEDLPRFYCRESGSTLRFLLPVSLAAGKGGIFYGEGKLSERPLSPLDSELIRHGAVLQRNEEGGPVILEALISERGLSGGEYHLPGNISSQFITGLLMALPLIREDSKLTITSPMQSQAYVDITLAVLRQFGIMIRISGSPDLPQYHIKGGQHYTAPAGQIIPEGDWSNGAFWLAADALGSDITLRGLDDSSLQGDKAIKRILEELTLRRSEQMPIVINAGEIPDLVPVISVIAALSPGITRITNAGRLRIKESDRIKTTVAMLSALGADIIEQAEGLLINGKTMLEGGCVNGAGDHRIIMSAAIAATCCKGPVTITSAHAVSKSYPAFFRHYEKLGGQVHIQKEL